VVLISKALFEDSPHYPVPSSFIYFCPVIISLTSNQLFMKKTLHLLFVIFFSGSIHFAHAQRTITDVASPVNTISSEMIENSGRLDIDMIFNIPIGKGAENFSFGAGAKVQYDLTRSIKIRGNSAAPAPFVVTMEELQKIDVNNDFEKIRSVVESFEPFEVIRSGFQAEFGYNILLGKKEDIGGFTYDYDNLSILHAFGGWHYMPCPKGNIELEAGPALGIFKVGSSEFGYGVSLNGYLQFTPPARTIYKIAEQGKKSSSWSLSAGIDYYKLGKADGIFLINGGVRASF